MALQGFLLLYAMVITLEIGTSFARLEDLPCASSCTDSDKLSYQKGSRYTYKYSTETSTFLLESRSASSGVALDSLADIEVLHKCLMVLKLRNVQIKRTSTNKEEPSQDRLRESLEKSPLQFSFQDGKIPEICPSVDEPTWVLNIKRGVLSVFQNSHAASREETLEETDVSGRCLTSYEWKGPSLVKTRDLKRCSHRGLAVTSLDSVPLPDSAGQLLDSSLQCVQSYRDGVMEEASCTEVNLLIPFSRDAGGAQTKTLSTLKLLRVQEGLPTNRDDSREVYSSSLLYEREDGRETGTRASTAEQAAETVRKLCVTKGLHYEHADLFVSLVFQLRALSAEALGDLWQRASFRCRDNWQPLVDALPACSSEACVSLIAELLLSREMEEERATSFLTSLTFIPQPTAGMITTLTALLRSPEASRSVFLGVSSVVHTFCSAVQPACASVPEVLALMTVLRGYLEEDCGSGRNPEQLSQLQSVLKAVGNAGLAGAALTPALSRCAETQTGAVELRLAALDAFRRIPCSSDRSVLLRLYRSQEEDVEVRITAYLQAMRCPSEGLLQAVSQAQSEETSSQVGAFVWSHLSQLMETEDPLKRAVRDSLPDDIITKDFDAESWKFSSYTDATFQSGYGGANVEAAMVFSPKSFLPRSAMGNLTVHVLGRAINLLEVNIRAENIEPLAQRVFGRQPFDFGGDPVTEEGQRTKEDPTEAPLREKKKRNSERHTEEEAAETTQGPGRSRNRKAKQQGCQPGDYSKLSQIKDKFTEGVQKSAELRCGLSVKIFGNELSFLNCDDVKDQVKLLSLSLAEIALKLLKGQEVQYNRRLSLASEELTVPSLSGLPIRLAVNASAAISLRVKGAVDFKQWSNFFINGYIKPNALVRVSAWLGVEGQCGQAGLEWVSGLKTSTSLDGGVQVKRGQDLKVFLNTPEETMEIFDISSRLFLLSAEGREELSDPAERTVTASCTDQELSMLIGWQLCCEASYPTGTSAGPRPLPGPMSVSVRLKKLDRALQQYLFEAAYSFVSKKGSQIPSEAALHLFMGTPKSDVNRDLAIDVLFHHAQRRLSVKLVHPKKNVLIEGKIDVAKSMRSGKLELLLDDTDLYYIKGRTDLQTVAGEQRYLSQLEAKVTKQGNPIVLSGNATKLLGKKMKVSVALTNVLKDTASVLVLFEQKVDEWQRQYSLEAEAILPGLFGTHAVGMLQQKGPIWTTALRLRYGLLGDARSLHHECNIAQKLRRDGGLEDTYRLEAEHELYCSHITAYNHKVKLKHEESAAHTESTLHVSYGKHWDEINNKRRLLLSQTFKNRSKPALTNYFMEFSLQLPERQVSYRTQLQHTHLQQGHLESSTHLKVHYNDKMPFVAGLHWRDSSKPLLRKWEGSLNMDTPWLYLYAAHRLNQPQRHTYQTSSELTAGKAVSIKNLVMETFYKDKGKEKEGRIHVYTPTATYLKVSTSFHVGASVFRSASEVTSLWNQLLKNEIYLDNSAKSRSLLFKLKNPKQEFNITAALMVQEEKLKKRNVTLRMVLADHKSPPAVLHLLGQVEELRREKTLYQKRGTLHFRHPFKLLIPQNIVLHETFTVDTERKHYVLETRAVLDENEETVQTLTLGYQPENPYVCAGLVHPYSAEIVPKNTEVCIRTKTDQNSLYEAEATVRINKKDSLSVLGRYQNRSSKTEIWHGVQLNMTHLFQLKSSQALSLKSELFSKPTKTDWFSYGVTGKAIVNKHDVSQFNIQLNGSSNEVGLYSLFSHPYQSKIPHALQAYARVKLYGESNANGSLYLQSNGKDTAMLEVDLMNESKKNLRLIGAKVHLHQTLLPRFEDVYLQLTGEASASRVSLLSSVQLGDQALQVDLSGFKDQRAGLSASVSGRVQHNMESLPLLPPVLGLDGSLKHQDNLSEGDLTVKVSDALYEVKLWNRNVFVGGALQCDISTSLTQNGSAWGPARAKVEGRLGQGQVVGWSDGRLCVQAESRGLCLNLSSSLQPEHTGVKAELTHSVPEFSVAGLPSEGTLSVNYDQGALNRSGAVELRAGGRSLVARVEVGRMSVVSPRWQLLSSLNHDSEGLRRQGLPHSAQGTGYYQNGAAGLLAGLSVSVEKQHFNLELEKRSNDSAAQIAVSLSHHMGAISQVIPTALQRLQVNCSGEATADSLAAHCSGATASRPLENPALTRFSVNASMLSRDCTAHFMTRLETEGDRHAALSLHAACAPRHQLSVELGHSLPLLQALGVPTENKLALTAGSGALLDITLGQCSFRVRGDINMSASTDQQAQTGWAADWTNTCPMLQRAGLPHSLAAGASLSVGNCLSNLTVNLQFDGKAAGLQLDAACEPRYGLHGVFRHSIPLLYQQGLPQDSQLTVSAARGPRAGGTVLLQAGKCRIRASGDLKPGKRSEWTWATETTCQLIKGVTLPAHSQFNGSVALDGCRAELLADMLLDGDSASLELRSDCSPRLSLEGVFRHSMPTMQGVPLENRLLVTAGKQTVRYEASVELASGTCELQASGDLQLENIIQWKFLMENKCKRLQDLGTPVKAGGSGFFVLNRVNLDSRMLINIDEARLQGHLTLKAIDFKQELEATLTHNVQAVAGIGIPGSMVLAVTSERSGDIYKRFIKLSVDSKQITEELSIVRKLDQMTASYLLSHNVDTLRTWIIDDRTELQAKLDWKEVKVFTLHSQCGARLAILRVQVKNTPMRNDITASFRHTWPHLLESGLPGSAEVLCYLQGSVPNIESSARITVSGDRSISYTLNMSTPGLRHFHFLFRNTHNSQSLQAAGYPKTLETAFTLQNQDPKIKTALEVQVDGKHVKVWVSAVESLQRDSPLEVSAELQHSAPLLKQLGLPLHLKVEGWGQARDADLDGSLKLSCEPNSSFIVMVEGKNQLLSKVLRVKAMHNIPMVRHYLPHSFDINTKLNYSSNDIKGKVDLILDRRDLHVTAALTMRESGYEEVLEISHTFPQLKFVPKSVEVTTSFQRNSNTHTLHHVTLWEGKELKLTATYTGQFLKGSGAPELQVEISHPFFIQWPRQSTLHVHMDHAVHSHLDKIVLGWSGKDQVVLLCSLNYGKGRVESRVTLRHPFRLALWHLEFQYNSEGQAGRYTHETQVSWNEGLPVGVRISLQDQSVTNATVWDTCVTLSPGQLQSALALVALQGCGSVSRGESSFTETLELEWDTKKIRQSLKHQKSSKAGADILQLDLFLENIFQTSCSNQRIEGRVETNYRYQLEHHLNLGLCHPHTLITVSGKHHVSRGELLLRSETRVSVSSSGQEDSHSALIVTARNHGSPGVKNYSIEVELQGCADVQLVLAGKLTSSLLQNHILLVGSLDHRDRVTLWVLRDSRCLQAFAGYTNGEVGEDGLELSVCSEGQRQFEVDVSRCVDRVKQGTLGHVSLSLVNGSLNLWAQGSREGLQTAEARLAEVSSQLKTRLLDKSRQLESKLLELRRDVQHTDLLLELSGYPLRLTQAAGRLVENSGRAGSPAWGQSWLRDALTQGLPRYLQRIQKTLQQMQDELKRPLGTLKDAYQDVTLRALDEVWREWVHEVLGGLESRLPVLIKEVWLRQHIHGALQLLTRGLDTAAQQVLKWTDTKLSRAVSRIRKSLAELYRYTASNGTVAVRLPVLPGGDAELSLSNITAFLLEERLMRPLRELGSLSPAAEYYRLKRRMMESPFEHHAVLIEGRFVVSFDGKVFEVAGKCSAVLAQDFTRDSFTVLLRQEPGGRRSLHLEMNQTAVTILPGPRVEVACSPADLPLVKNGVTVRKDGNQITMTNQNGVTVSCDKHHSFCTLTLSGWQHGVSAGLFGTNDNEAANEFTQPDHSHTDSIPHFIQSWQVGSQCRSNSKKPKSCPAAVSQHTCKALFRDAYSPLRNCFRVVDPAPFYKLCISSTCRPNADRTSCSLTAAFVHLCNRNLVPLDIPSKCGKEQNPKQNLSSTSDFFFGIWTHACRHFPLLIDLI
ncbi:uncharacterized protein LOC121326918 isoform X4 [Polyodon spathula]|uniref:uncharacterized protein LOC121326918 isoform X4 n=1 Tax=Polyodon spathula TaxID=7913 RepID=UPI001B7EBCDB|nr:uncharacterized protein LOC121326918 isoform X4 [Polyodon spathula]